MSESRVGLARVMFSVPGPALRKVAPATPVTGNDVNVDPMYGTSTVLVLERKLIERLVVALPPEVPVTRVPPFMFTAIVLEVIDPSWLIELTMSTVPPLRFHTVLPVRVDVLLAESTIRQLPV